MDISRCFALAALLVAVPALAEEQKNTVKVAEAKPPMELKDGLASLLDHNSIQLADENGTVWATFWLRKTTPTTAEPEQIKNGLTYREIVPGTLVGAVKFTQPWSDFRKQQIPAGVYTLRLATQPMDGDHQGTAPYQDFCLLVPADKDTNPEPIEFRKLTELSANAPGGTHPGVMLLFPNNKPTDAPTLASMPGNIVLLNSVLKIDAGNTPAKLGFAFVVSGHTMQE